MSKPGIDDLCMSVLALLVLILASPTLAGESPADDFVHVKDIVPDLVIDLKYHTDDNFVGKRIDGYLSGEPVLTRQAAEALGSVQADLNRFGLGLKIFDAYRPRRAVLEFVRWAKDLNDLKTRAAHYPNVPKNELFEREYIADHSSHSRGSTVDVTIVALSSRQPPRVLDMGTEFDFFDELSWPVAGKLGPKRPATCEPGFAPVRDAEARIQNLRAGMVALYAERRAISQDGIRFPRGVKESPH